MDTPTFLFGYNGSRKSPSDMMLSKTWSQVHPEMRRRVLAMMRACPYDLGFGNGWRSDADQMATQPVPPALSYHCSSDAFGYALAVDLLNYRPAITWAVENCGLFWLYSLASYNNEVWHYQPKEVPRSKRYYNKAIHTLGYWPGDVTKPFVCPFPNVSMKPGSSGVAVRQLQTQLKGWSGFYSGAVDGQYGPMTVEAVKRGQRETILDGRDPGPVDGVFGPKTRAAFCAYYQARGWSL